MPKEKRIGQPVCWTDDIKGVMRNVYVYKDKILIHCLGGNAIMKTGRDFTGKQLVVRKSIAGILVGKPAGIDACVKLLEKSNVRLLFL